MSAHDAYWCERCDIWLEEACTDQSCVFCKNRPEKPSMVPNRKSWTGELSKHEWVAALNTPPFPWNDLCGYCKGYPDQEPAGSESCWGCRED